MTFDELLAKFQPYVEAALAEKKAGTGDLQLGVLAASLEPLLAAHIPQEKLKLAADMAANELVSRLENPQTDTYERNPDTEYGADQEAPPPVAVGVAQPPPEEMAGRIRTSQEAASKAFDAIYKAGR
jgi:hypothetical protein